MLYKVNMKIYTKMSLLLYIKLLLLFAETYSLGTSLSIVIFYTLSFKR